MTAWQISNNWIYYATDDLYVMYDGFLKINRRILQIYDVLSKVNLVHDLDDRGFIMMPAWPNSIIGRHYTIFINSFMHDGFFLITVVYHLLRRFYKLSVVYMFQIFFSVYHRSLLTKVK